MKKTFVIFYLAINSMVVLSDSTEAHDRADAISQFADSSIVILNCVQK